MCRVCHNNRLLSVQFGCLQAFKRGISESMRESTPEGTARLKALLGSVYLEQGTYNLAIDQLDQALATYQMLTESNRMNSITQHEKGEWMLHLGKAHSHFGNDSEALQTMQHAIGETELWEARRGADNRLTLVDALRRSCKFTQASIELKKATKLLAKHPKMRLQQADIRNTLGRQLTDYEWKHTESAREMRLALDLHRSELGDDHATTAITMYNLAHALRRGSVLREAAAMYTEVLQIQLQHHDPTHFHVLNTRMNQGITEGQIGNLEQAHVELSNVVEVLRYATPPAALLEQQAQAGGLSDTT